MKLISVALHGFKRFEQRSSMNVDGKQVAIVGPNESGKSSFLQALEHLNHHEPVDNSSAARETTRNTDIPSDRRVIEATYLLEDSDRNALKDIHGSEQARWCEVYKTTEEGSFYNIIPRPKRTLEPRQRMSKILSKISSREAFRTLHEEYEATDLAVDVEHLASTLNSDVQTITSDDLQEIKSVAASLEDALSDSTCVYLHELVQRLGNLAEHETGNPYGRAINILASRRPQFLMFSDEHRMLQSEYDLTEVHEEPPAALSNVAQLAGLDLEVLYSNIATNDDAEVESILEQANDQLRRRFYETWSQSSIAVRLRTDERVLKVLVREETSGQPRARFTSIAERSDGLRQFVALLAFADAQRSERSSILLVDEVETHLHYDAQADLVQMLAKQEIASKVIYTTHSIGCLPEDLGTGVRFIESQEPESFTSRIENSFWTSNRSGFSPLLFGMGASALAFVPLRNAVITEGPSDIILWPRLLREATDRVHLDFQIAPGVSKADRPSIIVLDSEAPRTAYLLDADEGGNKLRSELIGAGIAEDAIFSVPQDVRSEMVVEDLIDAAIYVQAVNEELRRSNGDTYSFPAGDLPDEGRPTAIREWCRVNGINEPKKVAVAYRVIEEGISVPILAEPYRESLAQLYLDISAALQAEV